MKPPRRLGEKVSDNGALSDMMTTPRKSGTFSRLIAGRRFEASDFPGLPAVTFPLKSVDWGLLKGGRRRGEQVCQAVEDGETGTNSGIFGARL